MSVSWLRRCKPRSVAIWVWDNRLRLATYFAMEACALLSNYGASNMSLALGVSLVMAWVIGYVVGGQTKFLLHNSVTWRDHHPTLEGIGSRWLRFIAGNVVGLVIYVVARQCYTIAGAPDTVAFMLAICTSAAWNAAWNWLRVFGTRRPLRPHIQEEDQ